MKKLLITLTAAFTGLAAFAFDSENLTINGSVSSYTKTEYTVVSKFGDYFRMPAVRHTHTYINGKESESASYAVKSNNKGGNKDSLADKTTYEYNNLGYLVTTNYFDSNEKQIWKNVKEYDDAGLLKSESEYNGANELTGKTIYKREGNKLTESYYGGQGELLECTVSTEADGKTLESFRYYADGSLDTRFVYTYDASGKVSKIDSFEAEGKLTEKVTFVYTPTGALKEIQTSNADNVLYERILYVPDSQGNPKKSYTYKVSQKFGGTVNELVSTSDYTFNY